MGWAEGQFLSARKDSDIGVEVQSFSKVVGKDNEREFDQNKGAMGYFYIISIYRKDSEALNFEIQQLQKVTSFGGSPHRNSNYKSNSMNCNSIIYIFIYLYPYTSILQDFFFFFLNFKQDFFKPTKFVLPNMTILVKQKFFKFQLIYIPIILRCIQFLHSVAKCILNSFLNSTQSWS